MKHLTFLAAAALITAAAGCAAMLPSMPERPEPESAAPAAAPSASAQQGATAGPVAAATPAQQTQLAGVALAASGQKKPGSEWIGKTRGEVVKKLGEPVSAVPVDSTGGEMLFYTHYVFESAPGGFIVKATPVN